MESRVKSQESRVKNQESRTKEHGTRNNKKNLQHSFYYPQFVSIFSGLR